MSAHRVSPLRSTLLLSVACLLLGATFADAQATKKAPIAKPQEKAKAVAPADKIDVNSATAEALAELPGVGEATARKIIAGRPYKTVDDLAGAGVTAPTLAKLKPLTVARPLPSPVDVNTATAERLQTLPGVGPALAKAIIDGRPYDKLDDLGKVKGLGEAKLAELSGRVSFGKAKVAAAAETAKAKAGAAADTVKAKAGTAAEKVKAGASDAKSKAGAVMEDLKTKAGTLADKAKAKTGEVVDDVKARSGTVAEKVKAGAGEAKAKAGAAMEDAKAKAGTAAEKVKAKAGAAKAKVAEKAKTTKPKLGPGQKININTATKAELDELFGIGEVRAQAIIDGRPYTTIDDVMKVKGIGEGIFAKIKDNITVD